MTDKTIQNDLCKRYIYFEANIFNLILYDCSPPQLNDVTAAVDIQQLVILFVVHPFMTIMHTFSGGYFQQDSAWCQKAQIIPIWFLEHHSEEQVIKYISWMCNQQICTNCVVLSCKYGRESLRNVSSTLQNLSLKRQFWKQKAVQHQN